MLKDGSDDATAGICGGPAPSVDTEAPQGDARPQVDASAQDDAPDADDDQDDARDQDDAIRRMVDAWPPITDAQRARLTLLLRPGQTHRGNG